MIRVVVFPEDLVLQDGALLLDPALRQSRSLHVPVIGVEADDCQLFCSL